jgi:hypothetical protein
MNKKIRLDLSVMFVTVFLSLCPLHLSFGQYGQTTDKDGYRPLLSREQAEMMRNSYPTVFFSLRTTLNALENTDFAKAAQDATLLDRGIHNLEIAAKSYLRMVHLQKTMTPAEVDAVVKGPNADITESSIKDLLKQAELYFSKMGIDDRKLQYLANISNGEEKKKQVFRVIFQ